MFHATRDVLRVLIIGSNTETKLAYLDDMSHYKNPRRTHDKVLFENTGLIVFKNKIEV